MKQAALYILFLLMFQANAWADEVSLTDEERRYFIELMPKDSTRLRTLHLEAQTRQGTDDFKYFSSVLFREAESMENRYYQCIAGYYMVVDAYNRNDSMAIYEWLDILSPLALRENMYYEYFNAKRYLVNYYARNEAFEKAINIALKIKKEAASLNSDEGMIAACLALSNAYNSSNRCDKACEVLEEAFPLVPDTDPLAQMDICIQLLAGYDYLADTKGCMKYLPVLENVLEEIERVRTGSRSSFYDTYLYAEIVYTNCYMRSKDYEKADFHLRRCERYVNENTFFMYLSLYHNLCGDYYTEMRSYEKAISHIDQSMEIIKDIYPTNYVDMMAKKADLLLKLGRPYEATVLYQNLLPMSDSIFIDRSEMQLEQIRQSYEAELKQLHLEQAKNRFQSVLLIFICLILIFLLFFAIKLFEVRLKLKRSKKEIEKAARIVHNANNAKSSFLKSISHDIRTPLNAVVGFTDLLSSDSELPKDTRHEYVDIIKRNSEELMSLVNNVLDLSRLESGMMKFNIQKCDVLALCYEAIHLPHKYNTESVSISFESDLEEQPIYTDTRRFTQMLRSVLYPYDKDQMYQIRFSVKLEERKQQLQLTVTGSPLADLGNRTQQTEVSNEINRLLMEHFNGEYKVLTPRNDVPSIRIIYPLGNTPFS